MQNVQWWTIRVPVKLIADTTLSAAARTLFMVVLDQVNPDTQDCKLPGDGLARLAGFRSLNTVHAHLRSLSDAGWVQVYGRKGRSPNIVLSASATEGTTVRVPGHLLHSPHLQPAEKSLYATFLLLRKRYTDTVQATQATLLQASRIGSIPTLRAAIARLHHAGWLWIPAGAETGGRTYKPHDPHLALRDTALEQLKFRLKRLDYVGEALMQAMLTECVMDTEFQDNARLSLITNPLTGEPLEFDRWYPGPKVAIEYNGRQHYETTEEFPDPEAVLRQQARDLIKDALARRHGITLITVDEPELTFAQLIAKVTGVLPIRALRQEDPIVRYLQRESEKHLRRYARWLAEQKTQ